MNEGVSFSPSLDTHARRKEPSHSLLRGGRGENDDDDDGDGEQEEETDSFDVDQEEDDFSLDDDDAYGDSEDAKANRPSSWTTSHRIDDGMSPEKEVEDEEEDGWSSMGEDLVVPEVVAASHGEWVSVPRLPVIGDIRWDENELSEHMMHMVDDCVESVMVMYDDAKHAISRRYQKAQEEAEFVFAAELTPSQKKSLSNRAKSLFQRGIKYTLCNLASRLSHRFGTYLETARDVHDQETHRVERIIHDYDYRLDNYVKKIDELGERMKLNDLQMDLLRGQLTRRKQTLEEQRKAYFRELAHLREQLLQKRKKGDEFEFDDQMHWNWEGGQEDDLLNEIETLKAEHEKEMKEMQQKYENMITQLKAQNAEEVKKLRDRVYVLETNLEEKEAQVEELTAIKEEQAAEIVSLTDCVEHLKHEMQEAEERFIREKEEALASLREELEEEISQLQVQIDTVQDQLQAKEEELLHIREEFETIRAEMQGENEKLRQRIAELELEVAESSDLKAKMRQKLEMQNMLTEDARSQAVRAGDMTGEVDSLRKELLAKDQIIREKDALIEELRRQLADLRQQLDSAASGHETLREAVQKEDHLRQEIAQTNFEVLQRRQTIADLDRERDPTCELPVWDRLQVRWQELLNRTKQRKDELWKERKRNMELVLATVRLLVLPGQATPQEVYPTETEDFSLHPSPEHFVPQVPVPRHVRESSDLFSQHNAAMRSGRRSSEIDIGNSFVPSSSVPRLPISRLNSGVFERPSTSHGSSSVSLQNFEYENPTRPQSSSSKSARHQSPSFTPAATGRTQNSIGFRSARAAPDFLDRSNEELFDEEDTPYRSSTPGSLYTSSLGFQTSRSMFMHDSPPQQTVQEGVDDIETSKKASPHRRSLSPPPLPNSVAAATSVIQREILSRHSRSSSSFMESNIPDESFVRVSTSQSNGTTALERVEELDNIPPPIASSSPMSAPPRQGVGPAAGSRSNFAPRTRRFKSHSRSDSETDDPDMSSLRRKNSSSLPGWGTGKEVSPRGRNTPRQDSQPILPSSTLRSSPSPRGPRSLNSLVSSPHAKSMSQLPKTNTRPVLASYPSRTNMFSRAQSVSDLDFEKLDPVQRRRAILDMISAEQQQQQQQQQPSAGSHISSSRPQTSPRVDGSLARSSSSRQLSRPSSSSSSSRPMNQ